MLLPEEFQDLANDLKNANQLKIEDVPDIELYMDQLVTLLDTKLASLRPEEKQPFVTSTMVNNYAKAGLLPPIKKKRYTWPHALALAFIVQLKRVFSIMQLGKIRKASAPDEERFSMKTYEIFNQSQRKCLDSTYEELKEAYLECKKRNLSDEALIAAMSVYIGAKAQYMSVLADRVLELLDDDAKNRRIEKEKEEKIIRLKENEEGRVS